MTDHEPKAIPHDDRRATERVSLSKLRFHSHQRAISTPVLPLIFRRAGCSLLPVKQYQWVQNSPSI